MRRSISIALILDTLYLIATGVLQLFTPFNKQVDPNHIIPVVVFIILLAFHLSLNRKPISKYFKGLKWKWAYVSLGILFVLFGAVVMPLIMIGTK